MDGKVEFNKEHGVLVIFDKAGKVKLVYSAPIIFLSTNKTTSAGLEWDDASSSLSFNLPDISIPLVIAFGLSPKLPDIKGGFHFAFPSFKFGSKGEVEVSDESESSDDEGKGGFNLGVKVPKPKFGFGKGGDKGANVEVDKSAKRKVFIFYNLNFLVYFNGSVLV